MIPLLLLAGLTITPHDLNKTEVLAVRVADVDADGTDDVIAVTAKEIFLWRGGRGAPVRRPAPALTVVGRGLLGVVRKGRYHPVADPFGAWKEGPPGASSLLAALGAGKPALLVSPGDVDGDGKDDPVLASPQGFHTPAGLLPIAPAARLDIKGNENFAVEYQIPVPVAGNWSGGGREVVFFVDKTVVSYAGLKRTDELVLPLTVRGKRVESLKRNHVFLRDIDADGRLDLAVVIASGEKGVFGAIEAAAHVWLGGRIYNKKRRGFLKRAAYLKVDGALLAPSLVDVDGDKDLDLVLATMQTSLLAGAAGSAPGTYHVFRFENGTYARQPAWSHTAPVPMKVLAESKGKPLPPVTFLPDLDGSGKPKALEIGARVRLLEARGESFTEIAAADFVAQGRPAFGRTIAAVRGKEGLLIIR